VDKTRLHVGCGTATFPGWVNIDIQSLPGVDLVLDVREGLPFDNVDLVFAEHFIEHLDFNSGLRFLQECRRALSDSGVLRISTPNLDWVWREQYHLGSWKDDGEAVRDCFWMNKAFRGWGHQFLYNQQTLTEVLKEAGFGTAQPFSYGESQHPDLRNLEHHEKYPDAPEVPHIVILEASGYSEMPSEILRDPRAEFEEAVGSGHPESRPSEKKPISSILRFFVGDD